MRRRIAQVLLRATGWKDGGAPPDDPKLVMIAAPHTSNWDLLYMLLISWRHEVKLSWLGKDSLFVGPSGWLLRRLGGIPVVRSRPTGLVESLREEFERADHLVLAVPPEGTRGHRDHWKSGFYRIALAAEVPVVCGFLDWGSRTGGFGPRVELTGDMHADMEIFRAFYGGMTGKFADDTSDVRLRDEDV